MNAGYKTKPNQTKIQPNDFPKKWGSLRCRTEATSEVGPGSEIENWKGSGFWSPTNPEFKSPVLLKGLVTLPLSSASKEGYKYKHCSVVGRIKHSMCGVLSTETGR